MLTLPVAIVPILTPFAMLFTKSQDAVTLTWEDPEDDNITGYRVLRRSRDGAEYGDGLGTAEFVAINDVTGSSSTTYTEQTELKPRPGRFEGERGTTWTFCKRATARLKGITFTRIDRAPASRAGPPLASEA